VTGGVAGDFFLQEVSVRENRLHRLATPLLAAALALLPAASACQREEEGDLEDRLGEVGRDIDEALDDAEPAIEEAVRDAGEAVGKGMEAAGEVIQQGGEELQDEVRDPSATTLPDTVGD
jgi:hypothetical protein